MDPAQEKAGAESFLKSLINKTLRVHTTDSRMFVGTFKCTDPNSNVILSLTHEYRQPSRQKLAELAATADPGSEMVSADMTSRYLGLIVIPGEYIVKMEAEEFVSQMKTRSPFGRRDFFSG
ncbi:hypothetical protein SLS62_010686 [Diatrype stigma]|uniref:Sm domain-containing protein n=1 Tax=Diatrype stigma TaxID=117547 RepID=A0AAN9YHM9_9PEZI